MVGYSRQANVAFLKLAEQDSQLSSLTNIHFGPKPSFTPTIVKCWQTGYRDWRSGCRAKQPGDDDKLVQSFEVVATAVMRHRRARRQNKHFLPPLKFPSEFLCRSAKFRSVERRIGAGDVVQCRRLIDCGGDCYRGSISRIRSGLDKYASFIFKIPQFTNKQSPSIPLEDRTKRGKVGFMLEATVLDRVTFS